MRRTTRKLGAALVAVLLVATTLTATATSASAESVSTGYKADGIVDLFWAAEHFGFSGPGEMQRAGVGAIRFILGITGVSESECDLGLADSLDPVGPFVYESEWSNEEIEALEWVADHYCISNEQAQLYGGTLLTFFAGLDAAKNGTSAERRDPPQPPAPPTLRPLQPQADGSVEVAWTHEPRPDNTTISYCVDYSSDGGSTWTQAEPDPCTSDTWLTIKNLTNGIYYKTRVRSVNELGEAASSIKVVRSAGCNSYNTRPLQGGCSDWPLPICTKVLGDFDAPVISDVVISTWAPAEGETVTVTYSVTDESGVATGVVSGGDCGYTSLTYVIDEIGWSTWIPPELISGNQHDGRWRGTFAFPGLPDGSSGTLRISAGDANSVSVEHWVALPGGYVDCSTDAQGVWDYLGEGMLVC